MNTPTPETGAAREADAAATQAIETKSQQRKGSPMTIQNERMFGPGVRVCVLATGETGVVDSTSDNAVFVALDHLSDLLAFTRDELEVEA